MGVSHIKFHFRLKERYYKVHIMFMESTYYVHGEGSTNMIFFLALRYVALLL